MNMSFRSTLVAAAALALQAFAGAAIAETALPTAQADATPSVTASADHDSAVVKAAFMRADANGDGKLSRDEAAMLPAVAEKFTQLDKNGDGFISSDEFAAGVGAPTSSAPVAAPAETAK